MVEDTFNRNQCLTGMRKGSFIASAAVALRYEQRCILNYYSKM